MISAVGILTGCLLLALGVLAFRHPALGILAVRSASRRRTDAFLIVVGCMLGTSIITGSLIVGDSLEASLRDRAAERLGPVDLVVSTYSPMVGEAVETTLTYDPVPAADGTLSASAAETTLATTARSVQREILPSARLLEVDFEKARSFGDPTVTGLAGRTPGQGEIVLGRDAAGALGVGVGDEIEVYAYEDSRRMEVVRVLPRVGIAGYSSPHEDESFNAFVGPGIVAGMTFSSGFPENARPPEHLMFLSGEGDVFGGGEKTATLTRGVRDRLGAFSGYEIEPVKSSLLRTAAEDGAEFAELFVSLGAFSILAGAALLSNMLVMFAEERRRELGILRAMGMSRRHTVLAFILEGALYAAVAAFLGVLAGMAFGRLVVLVAGGVFSSARRGGLSVRFGIEPASLLIGFLAGLLVSLLVIVAAGLWIGRMAIVETIRDPAARAPRTPGRWVPLAWGLGTGVFGCAAVLSFSSSNDLGSLAFPALTLLCLAFAATDLSARLVPGRRALGGVFVSGTTGVAMVWAVVAFPLLDLNVDDTTLFVVQGVILVLGAVILVDRQQTRIGSLLRRLGGASVVPRLALTYPSFHRLRTATILIAYSLIVFTLVFSSVLSGIFSSQARELVAKESGDYDLLVTASDANPVSSRQLEDVEGVEYAATLNWSVVGSRVGENVAFEDWAVSGLDRTYLAEGPPALEAFDRREYPDEAAVWEALLDNPSLAVADEAFLESGGGPPENNVDVEDRIQLRSPVKGEAIERQVVGVYGGGTAFSGVMLSKDSFAELVDEPVGNRHYVDVSEGHGPEAVGERLERSFLTHGLEARTFEQLVQSALRSQEQFFGLIEGYLALGLLVGLGSLGVVMARAVRERRRQIAILNTLGLPSSAVRASFFLESGILVTEGVLIGAGLALLTSYHLVAGSAAFGDTEVPFAVPWTRLSLLLAVVVGFSLLTTLPAASRATATRPAAWLREKEEVGV